MVNIVKEIGNVSKRTAIFSSLAILFFLIIGIIMSKVSTDKFNKGEITKEQQLKLQQPALAFIIISALFGIPIISTVFILFLIWLVSLIKLRISR